MMYVHSNNEIDKGVNVSKIANNISTIVTRAAILMFPLLLQTVISNTDLYSVSHYVKS